MKKQVLAVGALGASAMSGVALAAADANVTAAATAAQTAFTDSFGTVATLFVGITVTVTLVSMAVNWFRRAAK
jgi:hypothetical protein